MDLTSFGTPAGLRDDYCLDGNEEQYVSYATPLIIDGTTAFIPLEVFLFEPLDEQKQLS